MASVLAARAGSGIEAIADLLACPGCRSKLSVGAAAIACSTCGASYAIREGVPLLAIHGTSDSWGEPQRTTQSEAYQAAYERLERAVAYNRKYRAEWLKRSSTRREFQLLRRLTGRVGHSRIILDLPCGGGRLTPAFADSADLVIEADIAIGQLLYGRAESAVATPRVWMTASAFHIPLADASVDGTICVRLSHHLPTAAERERLLRELLRVSRRFVIVTFFDHDSLKNRLRLLTRPFNHKPPKLTMTTATVAGFARSCRAQLIDAPALSPIGSGHRYALIVKDGAAPGAIPGFASLPGQTLIKDEFHTLIWSEPLPGGGRQVIKMYRRAPSIDFLRRRFLPHRSARERRMLSLLLRHGIACPDPLWSRQERDPRYGRCDLLATREIEGAMPLDALLAQTPTAPDLAPLFRMLRGMHDCGVSHGALMPRNILVAVPGMGSPAFHLIDFARSREFPGSLVGTRIADIDLLSLLQALGRQVSLAQAGPWLAAYGLTGSAATGLLARAARHWPGRPWRHLRRIEIDVRLAAARIGRAAGAARGR